MKPNIFKKVVSKKKISLLNQNATYSFNYFYLLACKYLVNNKYIHFFKINNL